MIFGALGVVVLRMMMGRSLWSASVGSVSLIQAIGMRLRKKVNTLDQNCQSAFTEVIETYCQLTGKMGIIIASIKIKGGDLNEGNF